MSNIKPGSLRLHRRFVLRAGAATAVAAAATPLRYAEAAEFELKLSHPFAESHPSSIRSSEAAKAIEEQTGGRVKLRVFPNSQLGSQADSINQVRSGAVDMTTQALTVLATIAPAASIIGTALAFPNYDVVWQAMDGDLGAYIRKDFANANLVAMDRFWDSGYRHITSSTKPIATVEDLDGFKIRVPTAPAYVALFKALGASPTSLDMSELYSALQTKIVDGQENPIPTIVTGKFFEVQKYCSLTGHMWEGLAVVANRRSWQRLPADLQAIIAKNLNEAGVRQRSDVATLTESMKTDLEKAGIVINKPNMAQFRQRLVKAGYYTEYKARYKPEAWELLTKYVGQI